MRRVLFSVLLVIAAAGLYSQDLRIDFRFNVEKEDAANYLNWSMGNAITRDKFDAASGASVAGSTYGFDVARYDNETTKNAALPAALRNLLLFPVSPFGIAKADNFTVDETKEGLVIRFVHRGVAYELKTDKKGNYNVVTDARAARGLADNVGGKFIIKEEFARAGTDGSKGADLDWDKINLVPDTRAVTASRWYEGSLKVNYKKGILTMKGTLEEIKR